MYTTKPDQTAVVLITITQLTAYLQNGSLAFSTEKKPKKRCKLLYFVRQTMALYSLQARGKSLSYTDSLISGVLQYRFCNSSQLVGKDCNDVSSFPLKHRIVNQFQLISTSKSGSKLKLFCDFENLKSNKPVKQDAK